MSDFREEIRQLAAQNDELRVWLEAERNQAVMLEQKAADLLALINELRNKSAVIQRMEECAQRLDGRMAELEQAVQEQADSAGEQTQSAEESGLNIAEYEELRLQIEREQARADEAERKVRIAKIKIRKERTQHDEQIAALQAEFREKEEAHTVHAAELEWELQCERDALKEANEQIEFLQQALEKCEQENRAVQEQLHAEREEEAARMFDWGFYRYKEPSGEEHWGVQILGFNKFNGYNGLNVEQLVIPEQIRGRQVIGIGEGAFKGADGIREAYLPEGLLEIKNSAFQECRELQTIHLPASLLEIGSSAFESCIRLEKISALEKLVSIGEKAFAYCSIEHIRFPTSLKIIPQECCAYCNNLKTVVLREGLEEIGEKAFLRAWDYSGEGIHMSYVVIPKSVRVINDQAFGNRPKTARAFLNDRDDYGVRYNDYSDNEAAFYVIYGSAVEKDLRNRQSSWQNYRKEYGGNAWNNIYPLSEFPFPIE